jgi:hypothetical protein
MVKGITDDEDSKMPRVNAKCKPFLTGQINLNHRPLIERFWRRQQHAM